MKNKIVLVAFLSTVAFSCSTIRKEKQSAKAKTSTSVKSQSDSTSKLREKTQSRFNASEQTGVWTFEEWFRADEDADSAIRPAYFPPGYPNVPNAPAADGTAPKKNSKQGKGSYYRKSTYTNTNKTTAGAESKDLSLDKAANNELKAQSDSTGKTESKTVVSTPDYGWIMPLSGVIILVCFVGYIWYRKTRPVAKIIRMIPADHFQDA